MATMVKDWSQGTIAPTPPSVTAVLAAVFPRSLAIADSRTLLQEDNGFTPAETFQWLAVESWLHSCAETVATAQAWEDVKGLVEACYHACQLRQWDLVEQLVSWPVGRDQHPLYDCLEFWGRHQCHVDIFTALQGKLNASIDLLCLDKLGHAHRHLGNYTQAQQCHEAQLKLAQAVGDSAAEMDAYWGLSATCASAVYGCGATQPWRDAFGTGNVARSYCEHYYALAHRLGDAYHQARALYQWGRTYRYHNIGSKQGILFFNRALALAQTLPDSALEARILIELGSAHFFARNYVEAQRYMKAGIALKHQAGIVQKPDMEMEIWANLFLIFTEFLLGNIEQGHRGLQQIMATCQNIYDISLEIFALNNIAVCLSQYTLDRETAIEYTEKALDLALRFGFLRVVMASAANLAVLHSLQHNGPVAQAHLRHATSLYRNYRPWLDREEKGVFFAYTAHAYWLQGQRLRGLFNLAYCLLLLPPWRSVNGQLIWRKAVATLTPPWLRSQEGASSQEFRS